MPFLSGEAIGKLLVFILTVPVITAPLAYLFGKYILALVSNAISPLLVLAGVALSVMQAGVPAAGVYPSEIFFLVLQGLAVAVSVIGLWLRPRYAALIIWPVWILNLLTLAALFSLSFLFRIF